MVWSTHHRRTSTVAAEACSDSNFRKFGVDVAPIHGDHLFVPWPMDAGGERERLIVKTFGKQFASTALDSRSG